MMRYLWIMCIAAAVAGLAHGQTAVDTAEGRIRYEVANDMSPEAYAAILKKLAADPGLKVLNTALRFDGENDVVNCGNVTGLNNLKTLTIEMWVNIEKFSEWRTFFAKRINNYDRIQFQEFSNPGDIGIAVSSGKVLGYYHTTDQPVTIGDWFFLTMVYDGNETEHRDRLKLYINGRIAPIVPIKGEDVPAQTPENNRPLLLGAERPDGAWGYAGTMDDVRFWDIVRTPAQIQEDMRGVKPENNDHVLGYYDFNENGGTRLGDKARDAHGRLDNFALQGTNSNWVIREYDAPSVPASDIRVTDITFNTAQLAWNCGSGAYRDVFIRKTGPGAGKALPDKGVTYIPGSFGAGTQIGTSGWFCVYNGSACNAYVAGLESETQYKAQVIEYNGVPGLESYAVITSSGNPVAFMTPKEPLPPVPSRQVDSLRSVNVGPHQGTLRWFRGDGAGCAVFVSADSNAHVPAVDTGRQYTGYPHFGEGDASGRWFCVYSGTGDSCIVDSLVPGTTYKTVAFEYNGARDRTVWLNLVQKGNTDTFTTPVPPQPVVVAPAPPPAPVPPPPVIAAATNPYWLYGGIGGGILLTTLLVLVGLGGDDDGGDAGGGDIFDLGTPPASPFSGGQ